MAVNKGMQYREVELTPKNGPSSDCRLQLAYMKLELLVIADQHAAVNTFPGLVHTARHTMGAGKSRNKVAVSEGAAGSPPFYGERKYEKYFRIQGRNYRQSRSVV